MQGCYNQMETIFSPQKRQPLVGVRVTTENTVEHITLRKKNNCLGDKNSRTYEWAFNLLHGNSKTDFVLAFYWVFSS